MIDLSIIILNFNTKDLTLQCIESIKKSESKTKYEIIVVDNSSTDGSVEALRKPQAANYKLLINKENLGFSKASNQGIKKAKGKHILLLNSDTRIEKGAIDKLYEFAKKTPDAGAVVPKLFNPNGSVQASVFRLPTIGRTIRQYWLGQKGVLDKYVPVSPSRSGARQVEAAVMAAYMITPEAFKKVGKLNEKYFLYFEDMDYARELGWAGLKIYYLPEAEVIHEHGASGKDLMDDLNQWRRLMPSSRIYHGVLKHYIIFFVMWVEQRLRRTFRGRG